MIPIDTSSIPAEIRALPAFDQNFTKISGFFNSDKFDQRGRTIISLHEGTHLHYKRVCGFEPKLYGPELQYDSKTNEFGHVVGAVQGMPDRITMTVDPIMVAKTFLAPAFVQEKLLAFKSNGHFEVGDEYDIENFNDWCARRAQRKGDIDPNLFDQTREAVFRDLRSPAFRKKLWDAAREFEARVFGRPNEENKSEGYYERSFRNGLHSWRSPVQMGSAIRG